MDVKPLGRMVVLLAGLCLAAGAQQPKWQGTWAASVGNGGVTAFMGTWTADPGPAAESVTGTWKLQGPNGAELASGSWAAAKEGKTWKGVWQARRLGGQVYNGTWGAPVELPVTAPFGDLLEAGLAKAISGVWGYGSSAGGWTIRAYPQR
jgi:hypothetical protein